MQLLVWTIYHAWAFPQAVSFPGTGKSSKSDLRGAISRTLDQQEYKQRLRQLKLLNPGIRKTKRWLKSQSRLLLSLKQSMLYTVEVCLFPLALVTQFECPSIWTHPDHISGSSLHITSRGMIVLHFRFAVHTTIVL